MGILLLPIYRYYNFYFEIINDGSYIIVLKSLNDYIETKTFGIKKKIKLN